MITGNKPATMIAVLILSFYFSYPMVGYKTQLIWFGIASFLALIHYERTNNNFYVILIAIFAECSTISYCTSVILIIYLAYRVFKVQRAKGVIIYICTLIAFSMLLFISLLQYDSIGNLINSINYALSSNGTGRGGHNAIISLAQVCILIVVGYFMLFCVKKSKRVYVILSITLVTILMILIVLKPATVTISRFWYALVIGASWGIFLPITQNDTIPIVKTLNAYSIITCLAIAIATNQGLSIVAYGMIYSLMSLIIKSNCSGKSKHEYALSYTIIGVLVFAFCFFVSDDEALAEGRGNIFSFREQVTADDILKGMFLKPSQFDEYQKFRIVLKECKEDDILLLLNNQTYGYLETCSKMSLNNSFQNDYEKIINHYDFFPQSMPTIIIMDNQQKTKNDARLLSWINKNYIRYKVLYNYEIYRK